MTTADGRPLRVLSLPMPAPLFLDGIRLPASYANFYIGNEAVIVPTFNDPNDRAALEMLAGAVPDPRAWSASTPSIWCWGFGTLHCMTQQEPAGAALAARWAARGAAAMRAMRLRRRISLMTTTAAAITIAIRMPCSVRRAYMITRSICSPKNQAT